MSPSSATVSDLLAVDRGHRPFLLQLFGAELREGACGEHGRLEVGHRGHLPAECDQHRDLLEHAETAAAQ